MAEAKTARQAYEWPDEGELVVCTVTNVKNFGAFVTLDEYENKEGFIHIAEVSSGWIKYIRDYVREGQKVVCKVLKVDPEKGHIDLSLKAVNEHQRREKIQEWKNEQKAENLLGIVATRLGKTVEECWEEFGYALLDSFGSLYRAFEESVMDEQALEGEGFRVVGEQQVCVVEVPDRPGAAGEIFQRIADAGINVSFSYLATRNRLVIGAANLEAVLRALA